jgi:hypothetical protein
MFSFVDPDYKIEISISVDAELISASTEFDFIKYCSEPIKCSLANKLERIHSRVGYNLVINKDEIVLIYSDDDFNFYLEICMKKEIMDAHKETLTKIKKASAEIVNIKNDIEILKKKTNYGLDFINEIVEFWVNKEGELFMKGSSSLLARFSNFVWKTFNFNIYTDHDFKKPIKWQLVYNSFEKLLRDHQKHFYINVPNNSERYLNVLYYLEQLCNNSMNEMINMTYFEIMDSTTHILPGKKKHVASILFIIFPPYAIFPYNTDEKRKSYQEFKNLNKFIIARNQRHLYNGLMYEIQNNDKMILWNCSLEPGEEKLDD